MKITFFISLFFSFTSFADSSMDAYRWYLSPEGQEVRIAIDDLHDEVLTASPFMKWGRDLIPHLQLKKDVIIAVIDGGVEIDHPELKDHLLYNPNECVNGTIIPPKDSEDKDQNGYKGDCLGWDFVQNTNRPEDEEGHGTHVSGIIHSVMNGVQGNYKILPLKTFAPNEGRQNVKTELPLPSRLAKAFQYALLRNADVIHLSVGWPKSYMTSELENAIKKAISRGVMIVAAAGNSSQRATIYPCQMEGVICVGALRANGEVARFSNWGSQVDIYAPGEKILSTIPHTVAPLYISRRGYDYKNGTSQAAPFISASMGVLKGLFPEESSHVLYSRLLRGADDDQSGKGLKGLFHLDRSVNLEPDSFIYPMVKGLHSVVLKGNHFSLSLPVKNYGSDKNTTTKGTLVCDEASITNESVNVPKLSKDESFSLTFSGVMNRKANSFNCRLTLGKEKVFLKLKVLQSLNGPFKKMTVQQSEQLVVNTRNGGRSRLFTMNAIKGTIPGPYYYAVGEKGVSFYREDKLLGIPSLPKNCNFLRVWQIDYDNDGVNELLTESLCDKTHLYYRFLDLKLQDIYPAVKYKPTLTIVNYDEFEVIMEKNLPPTFRFLNIGFTVPTSDPWDSDETSKLPHYYELFPVKDNDGFKFDVRILENPEAWKKSLNLRFMPDYQVMHVIHKKLLVKIGLKTAWIDIESQKAEWANLDNVLLMGSKRQDLIGTSSYVLQSFLTPYEYRGFLLNGIKIRYIQNDKLDPLIDILGTEKNERGYKTVLRSFQKLLYLQYDESGVLIEKKESTVDRFDFLTAQDLIASVSNLSWNNEMMQLVDGTKVNTSSIDFMKDGETVSYDIPLECVTQNPIVMENRPTLPLFCARSKTEFEMRFIDLSSAQRE